jgi:hypothetical protein
MAKQRVMRRDVPSEVKIECFQCTKKMKFRELRKHLEKEHNIPNVSIACTEALENGDTCDFHCSSSLDCFLEHSKHCHNKLFEEGAATIFDLSNGFRLFKSFTGRNHTEVCQDAREKKRKEKMREAKDRWSAKQCPVNRTVKNTHATTSDVGDIIDADDTSSIEVEDGTIKETTSTETVEVEMVGDSFIKKKPPVIINIKKRSVSEVEPSESSVTEPARKVKPAECVNSIVPVLHLKHSLMHPCSIAYCTLVAIFTFI